MIAKIIGNVALVVLVSILVASMFGAVPEWMFGGPNGISPVAVLAGISIFFLGVDEFGGKHGPRF